MEFGKSFETPKDKQFHKSREICKTEENFLESDSDLLTSQNDEGEESETESSDLSLLSEEAQVKKLAKNLTDLSLFPEGPPDDFSKQFLEAALGEEEDAFFKISEEQVEKIKKKIKLQKKLERERIKAENGGKMPKKKKKKKGKKKGKKGKKKKKEVRIEACQPPKYGHNAF